MRDLWRPGSGMTLRRLWVLIRALPYESQTKTEAREEYERSQVPTAEQIRERQAHYARKARRAG